MARTIHTPETCLRCGETIPAGTRVKQAFQGVTHQQHCYRKPQPTTTTSEPLATERQVAYALSLNSVVGPFERHTVEQLRALSRTEISRLISLRAGL